MDILLSFPLIILAIAVVAALGTGTLNLIVAITVPMIPRAARVVRSRALPFARCRNRGRALRRRGHTADHRAATCCRT